MEQVYEQKKLQIVKKFANYEFLKKVIQVILPFSFFSFLFSNPSQVSFILHYFISHLSTLPYELITHAIDKSYIFLLCNGILVFLTKYSTRTINSSLPETSLNHELFENPGETIQQPALASEMNVSPSQREHPENNAEAQVVMFAGGEIDKFEHLMEAEPYNPIAEREIKEAVHELWMIQETEKEEEDNSMAEDEEYEQKDSGSGCFGMEKGEETIARTSTDELNRKFEEFIRKMKEEIRLEAGRQLIVV